MVLQTRAWVVAGSLLVALAQSASAQSAIRGEVLEVPVSTHLLMAFHNQEVAPWYLAHAPMSTRLLRSFRAESEAAAGGAVSHPGSFRPYEVRPRFSAPYLGGRGEGGARARPAPPADGAR